MESAIKRLAFATSLTFAVAISYYCHDRGWYAPDDCAYAHVAQRLNAGENLNATVQDIHLGLIHFIHAAAFQLFGDKLTSLRYPLIAMNVLQSAIAFFLVLPRGPLPAVAASAAAASLSFPMFVNPTANWHCLFWAFVLVAVLTWCPSRFRPRLMVVGFLIGVIFSLRQLTGVVAAIGTLVYLLAEEVEQIESSRREKPWLVRAIFWIMGIGLVAYFLIKIGVGGTLLFGVGPLGLIVLEARHSRAKNLAVLKTAMQLGFGFVVAITPLAGYHLNNGTFAGWIDDTFVRAEGLSGAEFFAAPRHWMLLVAGVNQALSFASLDSVLNGIFWYILPLVPTLLGAVVLLDRLRPSPSDATGRSPLVVIGTCYSVVSVHYQIPIYLFYSTGMTLTALLYFCGRRSRLERYFTAAAVVGLVVIGVGYHAGQPSTRTLRQIIAGVRVPLVFADELPHCDLLITVEERDRYRSLVEFIKSSVAPARPILALPVSPELYYLTERRNPCRFYNVLLEVQSDEDLERTLKVLDADPPSLLFYLPEDKYNTRYCQALVARLRDQYVPRPPIGGFTIYALPN